MIIDKEFRDWVGIAKYLKLSTAKNAPLYLTINVNNIQLACFSNKK